MPRLATVRARRQRELPPQIAEAQNFEDRLKDRLAEGSFLILTVQPRVQRRAADELVARFGLEQLSFDRLLIERSCTLSIL